MFGLMHRLFSPLWSPSKAGFTLVELLAVVAIMVSLIGLATPALLSLTTSRTVDAAASELADALDFARAHAMARNTNVWVTLEETEEDEVRLLLEESADQSAAPSARRPVGRPTHWAKMQISNIDQNHGQRFEDALKLHPEQNAPVLLQINSLGEVRFGGEMERWYEIGLQPLFGNPQNTAVIQVSGLTGQTRIFLP